MTSTAAGARSVDDPMQAVSPRADWAGAAVQVVVDPPLIEQNSVTFGWTSSEPSPFQRAAGFTFRYEDVDLTQFSDDLWYEIFLALQLKVFAALHRPVTITFPEPLCATTVAFWQTYHQAALVSFGPTGGQVSYSPWRSPRQAGVSDRHAVFFGGGKDSLLLASALGEIEGTDKVLLIQYVLPVRPGQALNARLEQRQEQFMLRPAREHLGFDARRVWTDYQANFRPGADAARPHLELFTVGALPTMLSTGVRSCAFGTPRTVYARHRRPDGSVGYTYARSRPEVLATQTTHYRRVLGVDLTVSCLNALNTTVMAQGLLAKRFPLAYRQTTSCTLAEIDQRWCYQCKKCADYALYGLYFGEVDDRFDYDRFFRESSFIQRILAYAGTGVRLSRYGNAPWFPGWCIPLQYGADAHVLASLDLGLVSDLVSGEAMANLSTLVALFGNSTFPFVVQFARSTVPWVGTDQARVLGTLIAEQFETVDDLVGPFPCGDGEVEFDFRNAMPTRTGLLDHIRS